MTGSLTLTSLGLGQVLSPAGPQSPHLRNGVGEDVEPPKDQGKILRGRLAEHQLSVKCYGETPGQLPHGQAAGRGPGGDSEIQEVSGPSPELMSDLLGTPSRLS